MPPTEQDKYVQAVRQVARDMEVYPLEAFEFVNHGLALTVREIHGKALEEPVEVELIDEDTGEPARPASHHVTGQDLCNGLRDLALQRWGMMARIVLERWNITSTYDFGRIVFALIDSGVMSKTDGDDIEDFRAVYDFKTAFERNYPINLEGKPIEAAP